MKSSEILREAAKLIERDKEYPCGACYALKETLIERGQSTGASEERSYVWGPEKWRGPSYYLYEMFGRNTKYRLWDSHGPRIIGLCLAAAIAESEGD